MGPRGLGDFQTFRPLDFQTLGRSEARKTHGPWGAEGCDSACPGGGGHYAAAVLARVVWFLAGGVLALAAWLAWQHRFAEAPGPVPLVMGPEGRSAFRVVRAPAQVAWAADGASVRIAATSELRHPTLECALGRFRGQSHLWIRFRAGCEGVVKGRNEWDDARVVLIWKDAGGRILREHSPLCGMDGTRGAEAFERVVALRKDAATPLIVIQNLGAAGEFTVEALEVRAVANRRWFHPAVAALFLAGTAWARWAFRRWLPARGPIIAPRPVGTAAAIANALTGGRPWALTAAAALWVALAAFFLFPGPWDPLRPFLRGFEVAAPTARQEAAAHPAAAVRPAAGAPALAGPRAGTPPAAPAADPILLKPPLQFDAVSLLFEAKKHVRPLMHVAAYAAMVMAFCLLLGNRRAWLPVAALAAGSEAMQWLWGFGFDWRDVLDLAVNTAGIAAGIAAVSRIARGGEGRVPALRSPACRP